MKETENNFSFFVLELIPYSAIYQTQPTDTNIKYKATVSYIAN